MSFIQWDPQHFTTTEEQKRKNSKLKKSETSVDAIKK